jgi:Porin PorA
MRRVSGLILAGLGAFLTLIAVLLPTYIASQVIEFPLNEFETATLTATHASYFSAITLKQVNDVTIEATDTIKGDPASGSDSIAVWSEFSYVYDKTSKRPVDAISRTFAFGRRTAQLLNCCGESINGNSSINQSGIVGYVFPFNTQKRTYQVFDVTTSRPEPFRYTGTETVGGILAYEFTEDLAPTRIGFSPLSSTKPEYYSVRLTYWVDPETGALLQVHQDEDQYLVNPATGARAATLFKADLTSTPATVRELAGTDNSGRKKIALLTTILPLILGILGVIAIVTGILLTRKPRQRGAVVPPPAQERKSWFDPATPRPGGESPGRW